MGQRNANRTSSRPFKLSQGIGHDISKVGCHLFPLASQEPGTHPAMMHGQDSTAACKPEPSNVGKG